MFILKEIEISFMATRYMRPYNHFFCSEILFWIAKNASESDHNKLSTSNMKPRYIGQQLYWKKLIEVLGIAWSC